MIMLAGGYFVICYKSDTPDYRWRKDFADIHPILCLPLYISQRFSFSAEFLDLFIRCGYNVLSEVGQSAVTRGIQEGRDGKGIIYVFAAGTLDIGMCCLHYFTF